MRLARIEIRNHSRVADLNMRVGRHLVLVGPNNSGKSALLRVLGLVLTPSLSALYQRIDVSDVRDATMPMVAEVEFCDFSDEEKATFPDDLHVSGESYTLTLRLAIEIDSADSSSVVVERRFGNKLDARPTRDQIDSIGWRYIGATRSVAGESVTGRTSAFRYLLSDIDLGQDEAKLKAILQSFDSELSSALAIKQLRSGLAAHLSTAMPSAVTENDLELYSNGMERDDILANVSIALRAGERDAGPLDELSDGVRSLVSMTLYDYASNSANIVAIDEPENHLHPTAQRALADLLQLGRNQKVLATHSPNIAQRFDPECVAAFDSTGNARCLEPGYLTDEDRIVAQWWTNSRLEPLTARYVFVVEGESDRIFLEFAARKYAVNLDRIGVHIFDLGGSGEFGAAYRIFGPAGFGVTILGLVDQDAEDAWSKAIGVDAVNLGKHGVTVCREDLESEYISGLGLDFVRRVLEESSLFTRNEVDALPKSGNYRDDLKPWFGKRGRKTRAAIALGKTLSKTDFYRISAVKSLLKVIGDG